MADVLITVSLAGLAGVVQGFQAIDQQLKGVATSMQAAGERMTAIGRNLSLSVTAPLTAFGATGIKAAGDFEEGMNKVAAISNATGQQLKQMTDLAIQLGAETKFSAGEAAEGLANLAASGFSVEQVVKALGPSMRLAEAAGLSLGETTKITGAVLNQFKLSADDLPRIADLFVATSNRSAAGMTGLGAAMEKVGPLAKASNQSMEDMLAVIARLADAGVQGEVAGTALAAALVRLQDPPKQAREAIEDLGLKIKDSNGNMRSFVDIMRDMDRAGASTSQIMALFGQEAGRYLISIKGSADQTAQFSKDLSTSGGEMQRVSGIMNQGLNVQVRQLYGAFESLAIRIGQSGILADLTNLARGLTEVVEQVSRTNPELLRFGAMAAAGAAALGPLSIALGLAIQGLRPLALLVAGLVSPLGLAAVAVGAFATAFNLWDDIGRVVQTVITALGGLATSAGRTLGEIRTFAADVAAAFSSGGIEAALDRIAQGFANLGQRVAESISGLGRELLDAIAAQVADIEPRLGPLGADMGRWLADALVTAVRALEGAAFGLGGAVVDWIAGELGSGNVESGIRQALAAMARVFEDLATFAVGFLSGFGERIYEEISDSLSRIRDSVADAVDRNLVQPFVGVGDSIADAIREGSKQIADLIDANILAPFRDIVGKVRTIWDDIKKAIAEKVREIADVIPAPMRAAMDTVKTTIQEGTGAATGIIDSATTKMTEVWDKGLQFFGIATKDAMQTGIIDPMKAMQTEVVGNSIIPDTMDMILAEWRRIAEMKPITERAVSEQITAFEALKVRIEQWGAEVREIMGSQTLTIDEQKAKLAELQGALEQMGMTGTSAYRRVLEAQQELARETPGVLEGIRQGWVAYYNDVTNFGETWKNTTQEGLRTLQGSISEFVQTGKFSFDDLKSFAIRAFGDLVAQGVMSFAVQGVEAFRTWAFGAAAETTKVTAAVQASSTASATAVSGFATQAQGIFSGFWSFVSSGFSSLVSTITGLFQSLWAAIQGIIGLIGQGFSGLWTAISGGASALWSAISGGLGGLGSTISGWLGSTGSGFSGLWSLISGGASSLWSAISGGLGGLTGAFSSAWGAISGSAGSMFSGIQAFAGSSFGNIMGGIGAVANAAGIFFNDMSSRTSGAINAIGGVASALAGLAAGNPLGVIGGAISALQGVASLFSSSHDNYSVDIRNGKISTGTNTNPNPQNQRTAEQVAQEVNAFLQQRGITDRAEVKVDDRGTVISLYGKNDFQRTDNNPQVAVQQFKDHIIRAGLADGGPVVGSLPFSLPFSLPNVRDNILTPLQIGEFVMNRQAANRFRPILEAMNRGVLDHAELMKRMVGGGPRGFATGGDAVFSSPTLIRVAEQGAERVAVRPLAGRSSRGDGDGMQVVFHGPVIASDLTMTAFARRMMREMDRQRSRLR